MDFFSNALLGLETALQPANLLYCFIGVSVGMLVGVLPGLGPLAAISLLFPITFYLDPTAALIMLAGLYYGTAYGGSTTAILLNVPGESSSAVACLDGYPLSKQGRGGVALLMTTVASFIAAMIGIVLMMLFSPVIVEVAFKFGPAEYFSLMVLGLIAASTVSSGSAIKGIAMVVLGIMFGLVGMDVYTGIARFNFGSLELSDGISLTLVAMGVFGITEVISSVNTVESSSVKGVSLRSMVPTRDELRRSMMPILRGSAIGSFFGTLPGTGFTIASFMAYAFEKKVAKDPSRFGKGAIEGVCAPEAANNAAGQTAFIPTMTLGIPGSATMALMLGVMMIHGITPGPTMITERPDMFWGLVMSFWIGNIMLVILNIPLIGLWIKVLKVPYPLLYPAIVMFVCIGAFGVEYRAFDVWLVTFFGMIGYLLRVLNFQAAPMILGFVLGPMMEEHFRRALLMSRGDLMTFLDRPISAGLMLLAAAVLVWGVWIALKESHRPAALAIGEEAN